MTIVDIILAIFIPWAAVWKKKGFGGQVLICFVLWLLGHFPGMFYAFYVLTRPDVGTPVT
jgi:uncharacterized membrane protein YqaE (UPF0057 family)